MCGHSERSSPQIEQTGVATKPTEKPRRLCAIATGKGWLYFVPSYESWQPKARRVQRPIPCIRRNFSLVRVNFSGSAAGFADFAVVGSDYVGVTPSSSRARV